MTDDGPTPDALVMVPVGREPAAPVAVREEAPVTIGRGRDCQVVLSAEPVSKQHARLARDDGAWTLTDLGSHNGTTVNGWRVEPQVPVILHHGDLVAFAVCRFQVKIEKTSQREPARHAAGPDTYATNPSIFSRLRGPETVQREVSWQEFRDRYAPVIIGFSRNAGVRLQDAEDILQDVMLGFFRVAPTFEYEPAKGRFRGYLKRATLNAIRKRAARSRAARPEPGEVPDEQSPETESGWEEAWAEQMLARALREARRRFDEQTVEAFELYARRNVPVDEVARRLGMSRESVYQAKSRVLKLVQAIVEQLRAEEG